ncbi:MAG: 4-alpha-glucanotransferase [Actinomycetota bacterium]|nr:4-alpha-glucanotransferase [Actinomycetota bacterium]
MACDGWGVDDGYWSADGVRHDTDPEVRARLHAAMGAEPGAERPPEPPPMWFIRSGQMHGLSSPCTLVLEDGTDLGEVDHLRTDLPIGYHDLHPVDGSPSTRLVIAPPRCHLPPERAWGITAQLYAARSRSSWGMGDFGDLATISRWANELGAGFVAVNPLHANDPVEPRQPSPYFPTSRFFLDPLYLRIEDVPGAADALGPELDRLAAAGRALTGGERVDRDAVARLKLEALEKIWAGFGHDERFERFRATAGPPLLRFATYCALVEHHGRPWQQWPEGLRHPSRPDVLAFATERAERVRFWCWLQWLADLQLAHAAPGDMSVVLDVAVGVDPDGADTWAEPDLFASGVEVGAPPDAFNPNGQGWGLPPFVPWRLRQERYEPFIRLVRAACRPGGGVRIDHVMGLFRLFWVPVGLGPTQGTYVRYPAPELLDVLAIESARSGAWVVGEDLGTVEPGTREMLAERGVLSYRLLWFEPDDPEHWPELAMGAITTHDLPTVAGAWTGSDHEAQRRLGIAPSDQEAAELRQRIARLARVDDEAPVGAVTDGLVDALRRAPCRLLTTTLDDLAGADARPNMPGTTDQWPNWSIPLPRPLDDLLDDPAVAERARRLDRG